MIKGRVVSSSDGKTNSFLTSMSEDMRRVAIMVCWCCIYLLIDNVISNDAVYYALWTPRNTICRGLLVSILIVSNWFCFMYQLHLLYLIKCIFPYSIRVIDMSFTVDILQLQVLFICPISFKSTCMLLFFFIVSKLLMNNKYRKTSI